MNELFIICDESLSIMRIDRVPIFGRNVSIPAIFSEENDALEVLFEIENKQLTRIPHSVHKVSGQITAKRLLS